MPTIAYLFPGQGSQFVGMGRDLVDRFEEAARLFEAADAALDISLTTTMFGVDGEVGGADEALRQTEITQPALFVHSMAVFEVLDRHSRVPDVTAGHSLGEYTALAAARAISFEQGLRLVRLRGELMARAGRERPGAMTAVLGVDDEVVERICGEATARSHGVVAPANFNAPGQVVISGDEPAVTLAAEMLRSAGAKRTVPLAVSGAFHSPLMEHARADLAEALQRLEIVRPRCPVYLNVTARPTTDPEEIRGRLLEQLTSPVRWSEIMKQMQSDGVEEFHEIGPGNVLAGLLRRTLGKEVRAVTVGTALELEAQLDQA